MTTQNRQWKLASRPVGMVAESNFEYREAPLPQLQDGAVLIRNLWVSFDPAMRGWMEDRESYMPPIAIGEVMRCGAVGQVVESKNPELKVGDYVQGMFGWQEYAISGPGGSSFGAASKIPAGVPPRLTLSVLGITGLTAYFGLLDLGEPKRGETVVVSGAAGATGSVAAQIARIKGCRVVGIAGGPEKCRWLLDQAKLDGAIDYKSENVGARLRELCTGGVDVFFDNVGGEILDAALARLAMKARVVLCGGISGYNEIEPPPGPKNIMNLVLQRARMEGFIIIDYLSRFPEGSEKLLEWVEAGEIAYEEDIQEGIENAPKTFLRLFSGQNLGKQLLKVSDPD